MYPKEPRRLLKKTSQDTVIAETSMVLFQERYAVEGGQL